MKTRYLIWVGLPLLIALFFVFTSDCCGIGNWGEDELVSDEHEDEAVEYYEIYPAEVVKKIARGEDVVLLDVRTVEENTEVRIQNSLLLPVQDLGAASLDLIGLGEEAKNKEIYVYCKSGSRSKQAYDIMTDLGYTNVKSIAGGMVHWQEDNYPFLEGEGAVGENAIHSDGASISFDRNAHDFGLINAADGVVETQFTVTNTGSENLEIGELSTSCGCTSASLSNSTIEPDGSSALTVRFDPNFHEEPGGRFTRTVFIPTNDPMLPEAEVQIAVEISK